MNQYANQKIENQTLVLSNKEINYLGHKLELHKCRIIIDCSARGLVIADCQFFDCELIIKKKLNNFRWHSADLVNCSFSGALSGNDFGKRKGEILLRGIVRNCDFSNANLDGCQFFDCEVDSLILPPWPCFGIKHPLDKVDILRDLENGIL